MKKALRMKRVHGKKSNIGKRNRSRVFSMVIFIMVLSSFFSNVDSLQVQAAGKDEAAFICAEPGNSYAAEGVILEEAGGEDSILEEKEGMESGKAAEERIDTILDGRTLPSQEKEYDGECEELFAPDVEMQDGLNMEVLEQEGLSGAGVNYTPTDTYPWGKAMSSSQVTLVAPDGAASHYQWQVADRETGEFTDIAGAETREYTFLPISGKWYRAAMDGYVSKAVQAFQALGYDQEISGTGAGNLDGTKLLKVYDNNQWYITNGVIAYTCVSNGTTYMNLDVLGKYRKDGRTYWMNTAYSNGWQLFTSSSANPSPVSVSGFGDADLKELRFSFEEANKAELHIEAAVGDGMHAFCFGSDVMPGTSEITRGSFNPDCAALTLAKQENGMGVVQMVGAVKPFHVDDPAVVLNYTGGDPDKVWLGYYHSRMAWTNNTVEGSDDTFQTDGERVIQCLGIDSGMVSSWLDLTGGEVVKFSFNVGNVVEDDVVDAVVVGLSANPLEGGIVSGGGSYNKNASVTVKAAAKEGYEFVKWTENGEEASSEASYSFTAASDRNLVAEFREIQPEPKVYQVQVSAEPSEGGSVSGGGSYAENSPVTVKAAAKEGYEFVKWTENGEEASSEASYSFTAASDRNLVAEFREIQPEPKVYQVQVSAEPSEGGSVSGGGSYAENSPVTVKAAAKEGYEFVKWTENGEEASSEASYSFTAASDRNLVAEFKEIQPEPKVYQVQVSAEPSEGGSVSGGGSYAENSPVTVKAAAKEGYEFVKWTENGEEASSEASYSFTAASDRNLVAEFKEIQPEPKVYQVQVSAEPSEGGSVSGGGSYAENSPVTVKAAAKEGYEFVKWTENGEEASSEASYSFTAASDRNLVAEFKEIQPEPKVYQVQVSAEPSEGGSVSGGGSYTENTFVTVKAAAKEGYEFLGWRDNGEGASSETSYSFAVTSDRDLVACFSPIKPAETEYTITFDANGGRINKWSAKTVNQKLPELPTASRRGYKFDGWHTKAKGGARVTTKTKFDSDATIFAQWAKEGKSKNINYDGNANGNTNDGNALDDVPKTGDAQNVCPWFLTAFLSGLGAWYFRKKG